MPVFRYGLMILNKLKLYNSINYDFTTYMFIFNSIQSNTQFLFQVVRIGASIFFNYSNARVCS